MQQGGRLTISTPTLDGNDRKLMSALEKADTGEGMNQEVLDRIFEPFITTKGTGQGTGLGLSQVCGFATQSGGEGRVRSEPAAGSTLTLMLPCIDGTDAAEPAEAARELPDQSPARILVVEDNEDVAVFAETLLSELGPQVTRAASGEEALEIARRQAFDVVLSDVVAPGMGGIKFAEILGREHPVSRSSSPPVTARRSSRAQATDGR